MASETDAPSSSANLAYVEAIYAQYLDDPTRVSDAWRAHFEALERGQAGGRNGQGSAAFAAPAFAPGTIFRPPTLAGTAPAAGGDEALDGPSADDERAGVRGSRQEAVNRLINVYRVLGHHEAEIDPLGLRRQKLDELELDYFGLDAAQDGERVFSTRAIPGRQQATLNEIVAHMRRIYCGQLGVQCMHIDDRKRRRWLLDQLESEAFDVALSRDEQVRILTGLTRAKGLETFIADRFGKTTKRFSAEGSEMLVPLLDQAIELAGDQGVEDVLVGMAHRGRLSALVNIFDKPARELFWEFLDPDPDRYHGSGDVKYHLGHSADRTTVAGRNVHLSLAFNPSHLEVVNPVVQGRTRAKQQLRGDDDNRTGLAILIHGDAAIAGQGVVQEILNMCELPAYTVGGTLHIVANNQVGFTTDPEQGRSTPYASDIARMLQTPIFHVNAESPAAMMRAVRLAMGYRAEFQTDVIIDLVGYRLFGHNEGDEPGFTQPVMYAAIADRAPVHERYRDALVEAGTITVEEGQTIEDNYKAALDEELNRARNRDYKYEGVQTETGAWADYRGGLDGDVPDADTTVDRDRLASLLRASVAVPEGFRIHPGLDGSKMTFAPKRRAMADGDRPLDWSAAEALAFASLLTDGTHVRITGQDVPRATFVQRHAVFFDAETGKPHTPLQHLADDQAAFLIAASPLSEVGVLGFEYGYSLDRPDALVLWEAQFGDFCNVAQVVIDQFITSSEDKWSRLSGLVMLLPHGYEGQGPEHSSARLERFLQMAAEDN
ncbi:MAG: 2-oxoglutarate dehydrogenase E1 component, partial [Acidobacteriota bacterium]